ncbi:MAG: His-Xaa-Ser system protein HxsD [Candidatus Woesearchaeota archaeon]|jgi:His-Xaa-Ser system protein HxsD|nr:His-Xaa-Ser system protein HxsD [Candidatus Woesearchaeota archaeon]
MKTHFEINVWAAIIRINKEIYPKEVLIQASYVKLSDFFFFLDQEEDYFIVNMKFKEKEGTKAELETAVYEFFDELIESQSYLDQLKRTSKIREIILEKALLGQTLDDETIEDLTKELEKK